MATLRDKRLNRLNALKTERSSWLEGWRELGDYYFPFKGRFLVTGKNQFVRRNQRVLNAAATKALNVMAAGMVAGVSTPSRPWFKFTLDDAALMKNRQVRWWLEDAEDRFRNQLHRSNFYQTAPEVYRGLGAWGTSVGMIEEDAVDLFRFYPEPIGSYCLANDATMRATTLYREPSMTSAQMIEFFGEEYVSTKIRNDIESGRLDAWNDYVHVIEPNPERLWGSSLAKGKPYGSCYIDPSADAQTEPYLRESGYNECPFWAVRWDLEAPNIYGFSPGMDAIGVVKGLQHLEKRRMQGLDKTIGPPLEAPASLETKGVGQNPGEVNYAPSTGQQLIRPILQLDPRIHSLSGIEIDRYVQQIREAFYADLFMLITYSGSPQRTAREIEERSEEKYAQLGPALERLHNEYLNRVMKRGVGIMFRYGRFAPLPPILHGREMGIEYISILAQAQKMIGASTVERFTSYMLTLSQAQPSTMFSVDWHGMVDDYAQRLGVPAKVVRDPEVAQQMVQEAQQAAQTKADLDQARAAQASAQTAKTLADTPVDNDSALTKLLGIPTA